MSSRLTRVCSRALLGLALGSCTMVTGATDYEVDRELEQEVADREAMSKQRSLDYDFVAMAPHEQQVLDVALVNSDGVLQGRARMGLPLVPVDAEGVKLPNQYPTQNLFLKDALLPGPHQLFFFVDTDEDFIPDGVNEMSPDFEHVWIKPVDPDGGGSFSHSFVFQLFKNDAFAAPNGAVVLQLPKRIPESEDEVLTDDARACITAKLDELFKSRIEVKVTAAAEARQVGYLKFSKGNSVPSSGAFELRGISDAGTSYSIETLVDGTLAKAFERAAPRDKKNFVIPPLDWFPFQPADFAPCFVAPGATD